MVFPELADGFCFKFGTPFQIPVHTETVASVTKSAFMWIEFQATIAAWDMVEWMKL